MEEAKLGDVSIESGVLAIGDPVLQAVNLHPDKWVQQIKDGKAICVGTGGDGLFGVIVRESNDSFDLLAEEGEKIARLSRPFVVDVPSGRLNISDMAFLDQPNPGMRSIQYGVNPGVYECMIYLCENEAKEFYGYIIVLKRSDRTEAKNENVSDIETLD